MANVQKDDENGGIKRAKEFGDAMLNIPGYADDSMFFIVRYIANAKVRVNIPSTHITNS